MEQEEYTKEEIDWSYIEFIDNQDVLDLLEKVGCFPLFNSIRDLVHTLEIPISKSRKFFLIMLLKIFILCYWKFFSLIHVLFLIYLNKFRNLVESLHFWMRLGMY